MCGPCLSRPLLWLSVCCVRVRMRAHSAEEHRRIDSIVFWKLAENCYRTVFRKTVSTSAARYREKKKTSLNVVCVCVWVELKRLKAGLHCVLCSLGLTNKHKELQRCCCESSFLPAHWQKEESQGRALKKKVLSHPHSFYVASVVVTRLAVSESRLLEVFLKISPPTAFTIWLTDGTAITGIYSHGKQKIKKMVLHSRVFRSNLDFRIWKYWSTQHFVVFKISFNYSLTGLLQ